MEYAKLVDILLNPALAPSRREERKALWREAGDVVQFIRDIVHRRINEGLTDGELLFPRAKTATFDHAIARACRNAAKLANLNYGRANGFTCHNLRHTSSLT
jgi:integrase